MKAAVPITSAIAVLLAPLSGFLWYAKAADRAMDKSGLGDLESWQMLNARASVCFWVMVAAWLLVLGASFVQPQPLRKHLRAICVGFLCVSPFIWTGAIFF